MSISKDVFKMRFMTKNDVDLFNTYCILLKLGKKDSILEQLNKEISIDLDNAEKIFNIGLFYSTQVAIEKDAVDSLKLQLSSVQYFTECLKKIENHWPAQYLRICLCQELPDKITDQSIGVKSNMFKTIPPDEDLKELIIKQEKCQNPHSIFLCSYALKIKMAIYKGSMDDARETLMSGLSNVPINPFPYPFRYLTQPLYDAIVMLRRVGLTLEAEKLKSASILLWPNLQNIRMS